MEKHHFVSLFAIVFVLACGNDETSGAGGTDLGGPDSLVGYRWTSDPMNAAGIDFVLDFAFDERTVTATNTCNGALSATTQAPVRYRYTANVPTAGHAESSGGGATCYVDVAAGTFDFEIVDGRLHLTYGDETVDFAPMGSVAGLYGTWVADAPGVGTLIWSMGGGRILATAECDGGLTATTEVPATFTNSLEITDAASNTVTDDYGLECTVGISRDTLTYRFEDGTLVMTSSTGDTIRFARD